jgi:hypothetical protein
MPFLEINGVTIPVEDSGSQRAWIETGDGLRTSANAYAKSRRRIKRKWTLKTPRLLESEFMAYREIVGGTLHGFPFDIDSKSQAGLQPSTDNKTIVPAFGADFSPVTLAAKYGKGSIAFDDATTNLLGAAESQGTAVWTVVDAAVLAVSSAAEWQGSTSLSVTPSGVNNGVRSGARTAGFVAAAATTYSASAYVQKVSSGSKVIAAYLRDDTNGIQGADVTVTCTNTGWVRIEDATVTTGAGAPTVRLYIVESVEGGGTSANAWYVDGAQVEQRSFSTAWVVGGGSRVLGGLTLSAGALKQLDGTYTVNFWTTQPDLAGSARWALVMTASPSDNFEILVPGGGLNRIDLRLNTAAGTTTLSTSSPPFATASAFIMVTAVIRANPRAGENKAELYINGALVASANPSGTPNLTGASAFHIGWGGSFGPWSGAFMDDLTCYPAATPASIITKLFASTRPQSQRPSLVATGDLFNGLTCRVLGQLEGMAYAPFHAGTAGFKDNARQLAFTLEEL